MQAKDVMTSPVVSVTPGTPVEKIAALLLERRISAVPVIDASGRLQGIVSEGDLMHRPEIGTEQRRPWWLALIASREQLALDYARSRGRTASAVMTRNVVTVTERTTLDKIAMLLERHRIKRVPVVRAGRVVGIVSRANLLQAFAAVGAPARASTRSDRQIRSRILQELDRAGVDKTYVNVVVNDGVAKCWGFVETAAEKRALHVAASNVAGVKSVGDNVTVLPLRLMGSRGAQ